MTEFKGKTMICLILDRSGSMLGRESDVIGGVNAFVTEQQALDSPACLAMVRFDSGAIERFRPMSDLKEVRPLMANDFQPRGDTPLLDAIGRTINELENDWRNEKPERAILVIITDGAENASKEFKKEQIRPMIKARQDSGLWAVIYLGANVDAFAEANSLGISTANAAGYTSSKAGTKCMYDTVTASVGAMRSSGVTIASNLGKNLGENDAEEQVTQNVKPIETKWTPPGMASAGVWSPPVS